MKTKSWRWAALSALGLLFSVVPPVVTILLYFPVWQREGGGAVLSGFTLLLLLLASAPIFKTVMRIFKSPTSYMMWLFIYVIFFMLSKIADEMTVIAFVGFVGNLIGAGFFNLAKRKRVVVDDEGQL